MEELIYILPFDEYGTAISVSLIIIALIIFSFIMRILKIPQKLMVIFTGALAMMALYAFQSDSVSPIQPFIDLAKRQKQIDQQLKNAPIQLKGSKLTQAKVRQNAIILYVVTDDNSAKNTNGEDKENAATQYISSHLAQYCKILDLENDLPYRKKYKDYIDMRVLHYIIFLQIGNYNYQIEISPSECKINNSKNK